MDSEINFNDYRKIQSIRLAGLTLFMGWNPKDSKNTYLLCDIVSCDLGDIYKNAIVSNEYLEIAQGYVERLGKQLAIAKEFRGKRNLPVQMLGMKHCRKRGEKESLAGSLIVLKPESLSPEYRTADCQLVIATGGFGCEPNARGRAVYVKELYSGKEYRMNIGDVLGIADYAALPDWVDGKLLERQKEATEEKAMQQLPKKKARGVDAR